MQLNARLSVELVCAYSKFTESEVLSMPIWDFMYYFERAQAQAAKDKERARAGR